MPVLSHITAFPALSAKCATVDRALAALASGEIVILHDDTADVPCAYMMALAHATTDRTVNIMATQARGILSLVLSPGQAQRLGLSPQARRHARRDTPCYLTSIEAAVGVTTGISTSDRAHTIRTAVAQAADHTDIVSPGHIFPMIAQPSQPDCIAGLVTQIAAAASGQPAAVLCLILNAQGDLLQADDAEASVATAGFRILPFSRWRQRHGH